jgi:isoleucyl-tRNA synthetase
MFKEYDQIPGLFKWTRQQRKSYRESQLSDKHINQLEEIGFEWGTTPWTVMYNHLVEFKKQVSHPYIFKFDTPEL